MGLNTFTNPFPSPPPELSLSLATEADGNRKFFRILGCRELGAISLLDAPILLVLIILGSLFLQGWRLGDAHAVDPAESPAATLPGGDTAARQGRAPGITPRKGTLLHKPSREDQDGAATF